MTRDELIDMMTTADVPAVGDWSELLRYYAEHLAVASGKLQQEELFPLIAVGAMIFQRGLADFKAGIDTDALFNALRDRSEKDGT